ncbi:jg25241, partial [Pararge aegeria aegeria]
VRLDIICYEVQMWPSTQYHIRSRHSVHDIGDKLQKAPDGMVILHVDRKVTLVTDASTLYFLELKLAGAQECAD